MLAAKDISLPVTYFKVFIFVNAVTVLWHFVSFMTSNFVSIHSRFSFMYFIPVQVFKSLFDWSSVLTQICVVDKVLFDVPYSLGKQSGSKWKTGTELLVILISLSWSCFLSLMFFVFLVKTTQHRLWRGKSLSYNGLNWFVFDL